MSRFIDVITTGDYGPLVIAGDPPDAELAAAWDNIRIQYADAMKDSEYRLMVTTLKELMLLEMQYNQVITAIDVLKRYYCKEIAAELNRLLGVTIEFNPDSDKYDTNLKRAFNRNKGVLISIELKKRQIANLQQKYSDTGKPSREYFESIFISISDHVKYMVRPEDITVYSFCERVRRLNAYSDKVNRQANGRRG